jgi:type II secretory pathway predicted ATPase ExeA
MHLVFKEYYGLKGDPFRLSPDHNFCYRYPSFAKGRAYMQYALQAAEGFVVITGAPGMGKTTLINDLLADYGPRQYMVATLVNTMLEANEVLRSAAYEFGLNVENMDTATVLQRLKQRFTQAHSDGCPPLLVVDEAQNLTLNALEELRMLTNLQVNGKPLLQIFLVGQEELREKLQDPSLEQLRQRVSAAAHLHSLDQHQMGAYIIHRLKVVGWNGAPRLKSNIMPIIEAACEGVPRRINQFCSRLLLHGAVEQKSELDAEDARLVFAELSEERLSRMPMKMSSSVESQFLGAELGENPDAQDNDLLEDPAEAQAQKKTVMPPPQVRQTPTSQRKQPKMSFDRMPETGPTSRPESEFSVPSMEEAYNPPPVGGASTNSPTLTEPMAAQRSHALHPKQYARRRRPQRRKWFGVTLVLILLGVTGVYAWYEIDQDRAEELLVRQIDSYLSALKDATSGAGYNAGADSLNAPETAESSAATPSSTAEISESLR